MNTVVLLEMVKTKDNSKINILIGLIIILSISTSYLLFDKYKQNQISKTIKEYQCTKPAKICALITYKYTDNLEVRLSLYPGQYYFKNENEFQSACFEYAKDY